jgi:hypothetical protein
MDATKKPAPAVLAASRVIGAFSCSISARQLSALPEIGQGASNKQLVQKKSWRYCSGAKLFEQDIRSSMRRMYSASTYQVADATIRFFLNELTIYSDGRSVFLTKFLAIATMTAS